MPIYFSFRGDQYPGSGSYFGLYLDMFFQIKPIFLIFSLTAFQCAFWVEPVWARIYGAFSVSGAPAARSENFSAFESPWPLFVHLERCVQAEKKYVIISLLLGMVFYNGR